MKNFSENKYTKVVTIGGKSSVGWWYGDDNVVQGFIGDDFDTREEAEAYRQTLGYKKLTTENIRADYEAYEAELMKETN